MTQPLLSILIPTVVGREKLCDRLGERIHSQVGGDGMMFLGETGITHIKYENGVNIVVFKDNKEISIGEKREILYQKAKGVYSFQIDDDDDIADNAIELILEAIKNNPDVDCITFEEKCEMDGNLYCANHSLIYGDWEGDGSKLLSDGFHFHRTPFYKNVIKTSIAKSVPFERIRWGEDHAWSRALKPHLKTEYHISRQIYYYQHQSSDPTERYGLDK